jgi:hypothetical protein
MVAAQPAAVISDVAAFVILLVLAALASGIVADHRRRIVLVL